MWYDIIRGPAFDLHVNEAALQHKDVNPLSPNFYTPPHNFGSLKRGRSAIINIIFIKAPII